LGHYPRDAGKIEEIFIKIENEYQLSDSLCAEALRCYISELALLVIRNSTDRKAVVGGTPYIEKAVKYMQENYMNPVKLSEIEY
jgi:hypothetical protein